MTTKRKTPAPHNRDSRKTPPPRSVPPPPPPPPRGKGRGAVLNFRPCETTSRALQSIIAHHLSECGMLLSVSEAIRQAILWYSASLRQTAPAGKE